MYICVGNFYNVILLNTKTYHIIYFGKIVIVNKPKNRKNTHLTASRL